MGRRRKCRLWWPSTLFSQTLPNSCFLFGWFFPSSEASLDFVVAFTYDETKLASLINPHLELEEILHVTNKNMPALLQDKSKFALLGYFEADSRGCGQVAGCGNDENKQIYFTSDQSLDTCMSDLGSRSCGCQNGILGHSRLAALGNMWIKLVCGLFETIFGRVLIIPKLDHLHWNGETMSQIDLHVIFYEIPAFGGHHYSLGIHDSCNLEASPCKKPKWFKNLHQRDAHLDLDAVIQAMNSANAAQTLFDGHRHAESSLQFLIVCMFSTFAWQLLAKSVASLSTVIYIILQSCHVLFSWLSHTCMDIVFAKAFSNTVKNIHFRCCQLLYWPFFLQDQSIRDRSCVEFAEKAAFDKHSIWSNLVVDFLLGNIFGIALWFVAEPACLRVSNLAHNFTNDWLRTGCVWLMGNPAGFKLNTELAGVLGMTSLNAIQIWSTLWAVMGFLFIRFAKGLALCGIIFGLTSAAALIADIISLLTMHILTLHLFLSLLYSTQLQALAALWRLFRGRKVNPLRHRLDSYDYTVEQHVVGSLLFTPILLLLPTTSAFYIFFTILHTAVSFICIIVEAAISFIHSTPYAKVFIWLRRRKRFPSGIWFKFTLCRHSDTEAATAYASSSRESTILVSFLDSNYLNLGEVVRPHYRHIYSAYSRSSIGSSAYGLLTGRRIPRPRGLSLPMKLQWMKVPWKEYWRLCHDSVYACRDGWCNHSYK
ncbi:N-acetylglucosaminyltransferase complex, subunit PIG-Q/GPI1 [Handroanthus impetiginosus]|uniref:N-acetylglucosaminyltransferase complex, subunit PIG-Q/GPI1 n=1 Tax=Handroanthus impetiginosus TaxID=429701 RepID=A0A2G9GJP4_9LAMI|nr:N-acetylglucosaminyltransferase complex, subunit PIG-Q/GPI1 [Handroanthus impetiginosus]